MDPCLYVFAADALLEAGHLRPGVVERMSKIDWDRRSLAILIDMRVVGDAEDRDRLVEETMDLVCRATARPRDRWSLRPPLLLCPHAQVHVRLCGCQAPSIDTFRAIARRSSLRLDQMLYVAPAGEQAMAAAIGLPFVRAEAFFGHNAQARRVA